MIRTFAPLILFAATFVGLPLTALAQLITVPAGLNSGDPYSLAFVTSTTTPGDINFFVANGLGTPWDAIGSAEAINDDEVPSTHPWIVPGGVPILSLENFGFPINSPHWDSVLVSAMYSAETGAFVGVEAWWTVTINGPYDGSFRMVGDDALAIFAGTPPSWYGLWVGGTRVLAPIPPALDAMSGVLTIPTPEPSTMTLACFAAAGLAVAAIRRRHRNR